VSSATRHPCRLGRAGGWGFIEGGGGAVSGSGGGGASLTIGDQGWCGEVVGGISDHRRSGVGWGGRGTSLTIGDRGWGGAGRQGGISHHRR
jgi:hypothetical protein